MEGVVTMEPKERNKRTQAHGPSRVGTVDPTRLDPRRGSEGPSVRTTAGEWPPRSRPDAQPRVVHDHDVDCLAEALRLLLRYRF